MSADRKERTIRVLQILERTDEKTPLNSKQIIDILENEFLIGKPHRESISNDIKMLERCGYKIKQAKDKRKGWYLDKHTFDDWELKIMMDSIQQAQCISKNEASVFIEKLLSITSNRGRDRFSKLIIPNPSNRSSEKNCGKNIDILLESMYKKRKIEFQYTEINNRMERVLRKEGRIYILNLYIIYWSDNNYYIIGSHDNHDGLTCYRMDRMVNIRMSDEKSIDSRDKLGDNPEFRIREYIDKSVNHFSGDMVRVEVEFTPSRINNQIIYDFAGNDMSIIKLSEEKCVVSFKKMYSDTLIGWFLKYQDKFKVNKPEKLKDEIVCALVKAIQLYNE